MAFGSVEIEDWPLHARVHGSRRERLCENRPFEEIIGVVRDSIRATTTSERGDSNPTIRRIRFSVHIDAELVDLFHSSLSGYRAQYFISVHNGDDANRYSVAALRPTLMNSCSKSYRGRMSLAHAEASLVHPDAKIWIHQGCWVRWRRLVDSNLRVARWMKGLESSDPKVRKKARWGMLTPSEETRLEVIGGFINPDGSANREYGKGHRAHDLCQYGFT